jgi:peptidoglycan/xylan/chitin deacetylase (PgdA/CDA1 family)
VNLFCYKTARFLKFIPLKYFIQLSGQRIIYPFYHLVSNDPVVHIRNLYNIRTVKEFEKDLDFLMKEYKPFDIRELIEPLKKGLMPPERGFVLSFDDGLREFHDVVAPLLLKKGIPAICFVNTAFVDNRDLFFRYKASILVDKLKPGGFSAGAKSGISMWFQDHGSPGKNHSNFLLSVKYQNRSWLDELAGLMEVSFDQYLKQHQPYLSSEQITTLSKQGFVFGAHSIDHPLYADLTSGQQLYQTTQSIDSLKEKFDLPLRLFSFPFTDHAVHRSFFNTIFFEAVNPVDLTFGGAGLKKDSCIRNIQRIPLEVGDFYAGDIVYGEYVYYLLKALIHKNTIKRS